MNRIAAPFPAWRLIPSRFPPIGLFDTVATTADLEAVMELAGWTNDRLVAERLARLPKKEWVFGRPNASIVLAAFLHAPVAGARFSGPDLGAWYAAAALNTAVAEVAHHLRREAADRQVAGMSRTYRSYQCRIEGAYEDLRGQHRPAFMRSMITGRARPMARPNALRAATGWSMTACATRAGSMWWPIGQQGARRGAGRASRYRHSGGPRGDHRAPAGRLAMGFSACTQSQRVGRPS